MNCTVGECAEILHVYIFCELRDNRFFYITHSKEDTWCAHNCRETDSEECRTCAIVHCAGQLDILLIFLVAGFLFIDHICSYFLCGLKTLRDTNEFLYVKHRDD